MLFYYISTFVFIILDSTYSYPRGKVTEKPEIPPMDPASSKHRKLPTHISEFTDPQTGLNPYVDLEEGPTSIGRNMMEDERRDDIPYFDIDLVEGDVPDRKWGFEDPKEPSEKTPVRWPVIDIKDEIEVPLVTTPYAPSNPPTTVKVFVTPKVTENMRTEADNDIDTQYKIKKEENQSFTVSQSTVIYVSCSIAGVVAIVLLAGACWWRRKLKTSRSSVTVRNEERS